MDKEITTKKLDKDRHDGLRPVVVGCITKGEKILFLFQREYELWQLPQGGIEPGETILDALKREMAEELGSFSEKLDYDKAELLGFDKVEFPKKNQGVRELTTENQKEIYMRGKKYYFVKVESRSKDVEIENTEFEKYRWVESSDVQNLLCQIYQKGKRRITKQALRLLKIIN